MNTPGALRAAKRIGEFVMLSDNAESMFAEIIDRETGARELLEALKNMLVQHHCTCEHPACKRCRETNEVRQIIAKYEDRP